MREIKTYFKGAPFYNAFLRTWSCPKALGRPIFVFVIWTLLAPILLPYVGSLDALALGVSTKNSLGHTSASPEFLKDC